MKVKLLEKSDKTIKFEIKDTTPAFVNALRRSISDVNIMAIDFVEIKKNTSTMYNETLSHRIGLIPLAFKQGSFVETEKCKCKGEGCGKCTVKLALKAAGPANHGNSGNFQAFEHNVQNIYSSNLASADDAVKPAEKGILIITLFPEQEIDLEATARLGNSKKHARWQAAIAGYQYFPKLKIEGEKCDLCGVCIKKCQKKLLEEAKGGRKVEMNEPHKCDLCGNCMKACPKSALVIEGDPSRIIMSVESVSGLAPKEIVISAAESLKEKLGELKDELKG